MGDPRPARYMLPWTWAGPSLSVRSPRPTENKLSFINQTRPYGDDSSNFEKSLSKATQRQAWAEHTAWTGVDYVKGSAHLDLSTLYSQSSAPKCWMSMVRVCTCQESEFYY